MGTQNSTFSTTPQPTNGFLNSLQPPKPTYSYGITPSTPQTPQPTQSGGMNSSNASMVPTGTNVGLGAFNSTTSNNGKGGTVTKPTPNPSVLEQQKALNKLGAGLVEDGLAGPKTSAAIAKYGSGGTAQSMTDPTLKANTDKNNTANYGANTLGNAPNTPVSSQTGTTSGATPPTPNYNTSGTDSSIPQSNIIKGLINQANTPSQAYTDAQAEAKRISDEQTALANDFATQKNQIAGTAGFLTQQTGLQGLLQDKYNIGQNALAQQYAGATNRLGAANTQQGLQVQAGTNAANANAPITGVPYGTQTINPATGQPYPATTNTTGATGTSGTDIASGAGGGVQPTDPFYQTLQSYAQMAANGQVSSIPSSVTGNSVLNAQMNAMAKKINPNYNPVTSAAQSGVTAQQTAQQAGYQSALQQGQNLAAQATDLINTFNLNPSELNKANGAIQVIASNTSNPQYKMLNNYLADISSRYAQILTPAGGSNTDTTRAVASGMLDSLASGKSLQAVLSGLDQQAQAVIAGVPTPYGNTTSSNGGGSSTSGFGWNG